MRWIGGREQTDCSFIDIIISWADSYYSSNVNMTKYDSFDIIIQGIQSVYFRAYTYYYV